MPNILDNIDYKTEKFLLETLSVSHQLDAAIGYFNLRGWRLLADAVDALPHNSNGPKARILVGIHENSEDEMQRLARNRKPNLPDNNTAHKTKAKVVAEYQHQLECGWPTIEDEKALQTLLRQIEAGDVEVRVHTAHRLHAKLYMCHRTDINVPRVGIVGSSNLTAAGLREQGELNVDVVEGDATQKLANWFEDRWQCKFTLPAMPELAEALRHSWASKTQLDPFLVYLKMAYHLSKEAREGLVQYGLPSSMSRELAKFQSAAVKIAARIVMQKGGAMIGDVVGLGKTIVGTAIARLLQEEQGFETLVVCPKNLTDMWEGYLHKYEVRGTVKSMSMISKELPDARRYRLVIVDEAHNFRNEKTIHHGALQRYIADNGSKALLLTATPYNKHLDDLYSQLSLFIPPDADLGLRPELAIKKVGAAEFENLCDGRPSSLAAFKRSPHTEDWQDLMAQYLVRRTRRFVEDNYALTDKDGKKYLEFEGTKRFYFPKRVAEPLERVLHKDDPAAIMSSDETLDSIRDLRLPRYRLGDYISQEYKAFVKERLARKGKPHVESYSSEDPQLHVETSFLVEGGLRSLNKAELKAEQKLIDDLITSTRGSLEGFTRVSMFKRLSSSGPAFLKTLQRHLLRNLVAIYALEKGKAYPIGAVSNALWSVEAEKAPDESDKDLDEEAEESDSDANSSLLFDLEGDDAAVAYAKLQAKNPKGTRWARPEMFEPSLLEDLHHDVDVITKMLIKFGPWNPVLDRKADELEDLLTNRYPTQKVLIFTEAADTAHYVAGELQRRGIEGVGVVTGDSDNPTTLAHRFSPISNKISGVAGGNVGKGVGGGGGRSGGGGGRVDEGGNVGGGVGRSEGVDGGGGKGVGESVGGGGDGSGQVAGGELRVLVSTDVLSEGQNLQDAHIIVNYDLPWAIVKLVQRAGRIDRIGQKAPEVLIHSMMPPKTIEEEIGLRERIKRRLGENAKLLGSDEKFFGDPSEIGKMKEAYDGTLSSESEGAEDVDPVSMAYEIWRKATEKDSGEINSKLRELVEGLPNVVYSTKHFGSGASGSGSEGENLADGVLVHSQTVAGADAFAWVAVNGEARRVTPHEALRLAECQPETPSIKRLPDHHKLTADALAGPLKASPLRPTTALQGVRKKVWDRLHEQMSNFKANLFVNIADLHNALDTISERPLYEKATQDLSKAVRERSPNDLAKLVIDLHKDGRLCVPLPKEEADSEPSIVCTMGLRQTLPSQ